VSTDLRGLKCGATIRNDTLELCPVCGLPGIYFTAFSAFTGRRGYIHVLDLDGPHQGIVRVGCTLQRGGTA
jgi:hypothetical protein